MQRDVGWPSVLVAVVRFEATRRMTHFIVVAGSMGLAACGHDSPSAARTAAMAAPPATSPRQAEEPTPEIGTVHSKREVQVSGDFSPADLQAIEAAIAVVDSLEVLSIAQRPRKEVEVYTGRTCDGDDLCGGGNVFVLRNFGGTWTIIKRLRWVS